LDRFDAYYTIIKNLKKEKNGDRPGLPQQRISMRAGRRNIGVGETDGFDRRCVFIWPEIQLDVCVRALIAGDEFIATPYGRFAVRCETWRIGLAGYLRYRCLASN